jgi:hypothetical protein
MDVTGAIPSHILGGYGWGHGENGNRADHNTILRGISDGRMENRQAECDILKSIADSSSMASKDRADGVFRLHENIRNVADQILQSTALTQAQVAAGNALTQSQIAAASCASLMAGEKNTAAILAAISATELRQLQDELNETRLERNRYHGEVNFGNQVAILQSQINSLDQYQRSTNQAINFGNGGIGPQTSTQNQVR